MTNARETQVKAICKMSGKETAWPCDAAGCPLFGDCLSKYTEITHAPKTNADRIRAMSDEELADWLARTQIDNVAEALEIAKIPYEQEDGLKDEVKKECLEWLKQPAEATP